MRNALLYILVIIGLGCTPIDKLEPNQTDTFLKLYGETNAMISKDLAVLDDGYLIMSTYSETSTLLLKTDPQGNQLWAQSFDNFLGNSLTVLSDGYILIGDRINDQQDSTYMHLIKTELNGNLRIQTQIGEGFQHGTGVTFSSANEIVALGYSTNGDSIILTAYDEDLSTRLWLRQYPLIISSKSIYETNTGNLTWLSYSNINGTINTLTLTEVIPDNVGDVGDKKLFDQSTFSNLDGDLIKTTDKGFSIVQTVLIGNENKIGYTSVNGDVTSETNIDLGSGNFIASSLVDSTNGILIAATTDNHESASTRTDKDLLLIETNYDGTLKTDGINATFGGIGDEVPIRIRRTNDGGFAVLGTLTNSKGAMQSFLLKTDNKGQLN